MSKTTRSTEEPTSYRPALVALSDDVRELTRELRDGLKSERRVLEWLQRMTIRTLGELDSRIYSDLARQLRDKQGLLLAALLRPGARRGRMENLEETVAERLRERLLANQIHPAHRDAFRDLRPDATEYVREGDEGDAHDPHRQRHIAMRPALSELEKWQERALSELLAGFDEVEEVLDWGHDVLLATHGEIGRDWVTRVVEEDSTREVLLGEEPAHGRARRLFAAYHILPEYRSGVRVLSRRAGEVADEGQDTTTEAKFA